MMTLKIAIFGLVAIILFATLIKNADKWAIRFRRYMTSQANRVFGTASGWDKPWGLLLSKAMVLFFGLMFIVFVYVVVFSL